MGASHRHRPDPSRLVIWLRARGIRPWSPQVERRRRWFRLARRTIAVVVSTYLLILMFPEPLFAHHLSYRNFQVYSEIPIDRSIIPILDEAAALMARSSLDDPGMEHRLFLCDSPLKRRLLTPTTRGAFGATYAAVLRGNTILSRTDVRANLVFRDAALHDRRPLGAVIAHERVHALMGRHFGDLACLSIPVWKKEGYCEYIGGSPSFDVEEGKRLIRRGQAEAAGPFRYFRYRLMVKYLMDIEGLDIDEIVAREFSPDEVMAKVRQHIDRL
jgi:hypothetical protein